MNNFKFRVCAPVDVNEEILSFSFCIFDDCEDLVTAFTNYRNRFDNN